MLFLGKVSNAQIIMNGNTFFLIHQKSEMKKINGIFVSK